MDLNEKEIILDKCFVAKLRNLGLPLFVHIFNEVLKHSVSTIQIILVLKMLI